jgi:hypothetical protein
VAVMNGLILPRLAVALSFAVSLTEMTALFASASLVGCLQTQHDSDRNLYKAFPKSFAASHHLALVNAVARSKAL